MEVAGSSNISICIILHPNPAQHQIWLSGNHNQFIVQKWSIFTFYFMATTYCTKQCP